MFILQWLPYPIFKTNRQKALYSWNCLCPYHIVVLYACDYRLVLLTQQNYPRWEHGCHAFAFVPTLKEHEFTEIMLFSVLSYGTSTCYSQFCFTQGLQNSHHAYMLLKDSNPSFLSTSFCLFTIQSFPSFIAQVFHFTIYNLSSLDSTSDGHSGFCLSVIHQLPEMDNYCNWIW